MSIKQMANIHILPDKHPQYMVYRNIYMRFRVKPGKLEG